MTTEWKDVLPEGTTFEDMGRAVGGIVATGMSGNQIANTIRANSPTITPTISFLGDSITELAVSSNRLEYNPAGYASWFKALASDSFKLGGIFGYPGKTAGYIKDFVPDVLVDSPDFCFVLAGTNDKGISNLDVQTTLDDYDDIIESLSTGGCTPIFLTVPAATVQTTEANDKALVYNNHLRSRAEEGAIMLVDITQVLALDSNTMDPDKTSDGVHPNSIGAIGMAMECHKAVANKIPMQAKSVPRGEENAIPNEYFTGTGGALYSNAQGYAPDGFAISADSSTPETIVTGSVEKLGGIYSTNAVNIHVATVGDEVGCSLQKSGIPALDGGDNVVTVDVIVDANVKIKHMGLRVQSYDTNPFLSRCMGRSTTETLGTTEGKTLRFTTPPFPSVVGENFNIYLEIEIDSTSESGNIKIFNLSAFVPSS